MPQAAVQEALAEEAIVASPGVHAVAGAGASMLAIAITYPLITALTRLQVSAKQSQPSKPASQSSSSSGLTSPAARSPTTLRRYASTTGRDEGELEQDVDAGPETVAPQPRPRDTLTRTLLRTFVPSSFKMVARIVREEGLASLYSGLGAAVVGTASQNFVFYILYEYLKSSASASLRRRQQHKAALLLASSSGASGGSSPRAQLGMGMLLILGYMAGVGSATLTNPLWVAQTRMIMAAKEGSVKAKAAAANKAAALQDKLAAAVDDLVVDAAESGRAANEGGRVNAATAVTTDSRSEEEETTLYHHTTGVDIISDNTAGSDGMVSTQSVVSSDVALPDVALPDVALPTPSPLPASVSSGDPRLAVEAVVAAPSSVVTVLGSVHDGVGGGVDSATEEEDTTQSGGPVRTTSNGTTAARGGGGGGAGIRTGTNATGSGNEDEDENEGGTVTPPPSCHVSSSTATTGDGAPNGTSSGAGSVVGVAGGAVMLSPSTAEQQPGCGSAVRTARSPGSLLEGQGGTDLMIDLIKKQPGSSIAQAAAGGASVCSTRGQHSSSESFQGRRGGEVEGENAAGSKAAVSHRPYHHSSTIDVIMTICSDEGVGALFTGLMPSMVLSANPAITYATGEWLLRLLSGGAGSGAVRRNGTLTIMVCSAAAKFLATVVTYPYQVIRSLMHVAAAHASNKSSRGEGMGGSGAGSSSSSSSGGGGGGGGGGQLSTVSQVISICSSLWKEEGVAGFFRGIDVKLQQTIALTSLLFLFQERSVQLLLKMLAATK